MNLFDHIGLHIPFLIKNVKSILILRLILGVLLTSRLSHRSLPRVSRWSRAPWGILMWDGRVGSWIPPANISRFRHGGIHEKCRDLDPGHSETEAVLAFKWKLRVPFRIMSNGQYFDGVRFSRVKSNVTWTILTALTYCARLPRVFNNEFWPTPYQNSLKAFHLDEMVLIVLWPRSEE